MRVFISLLFISCFFFYPGEVLAQILRNQKLEKELQKSNYLKSRNFSAEEIQHNVDALEKEIKKNEKDDTVRIVGPSFIQKLFIAAHTRRIDVANNIIFALKYHGGIRFSQSEWHPCEQLDAAIDILDHFYGENAAPLLVHLAITTENEFLRCRCAYALRTILSTKEIENLIKAYSFTSSQNKKARKFTSQLKAKELKIIY